MPSNKKVSMGSQPWIFPQPVFLVGSYDSSEKPNIMVAAWGGICCSDPVALTVSIRPARWTYESIMQNKAFTVSIPTVDMVAGTDYAGIVSGKRYDKFEKIGWNPVKAEKVNAPYIDESPLVFECSLMETHKLGSHVMMIGKIEDVKASPEILDDTESFPDPQKYSPLIYSASSSYYYSHAKEVAKAFSVGKPLLKGNSTE